MLFHVEHFSLNLNVLFIYLKFLFMKDLLFTGRSDQVYTDVSGNLYYFCEVCVFNTDTDDIKQVNIPVYFIFDDVTYSDDYLFKVHGDNTFSTLKSMFPNVEFIELSDKQIQYD